MTYQRNAYGGRSILGGGRRGGFNKTGLIIALAFAGFALFKYCNSSQYNEVLGKNQHVAMTVDQEIELGLQATPSMVQEYGGLHPSQEGQALVKSVGNKLVNNSIARRTNYEYDFHLLADPQVVNAFALPGGQVFITAALFSQLESEDQLAGVLGHEIGHVVARHGAQRMAKQELTQGLTGAAVIASGDYSTAQAAQMIGNLVNMSYGRDQELESDQLGVYFMMDAGYDAEALIGVMDILERAGGGGGQSEFFSTHPSPDNRRERIREAIEQYRAEKLN